MKLKLSILLSALLLFSNCDKTKNDFINGVLDHFYGYELADRKVAGILLSSRDAEMRSFEIGVLRSVYQLSEDFIYDKEDVKIKEIEDFELFITYSLFLKNEKTDEILNIETKYYYSAFTDEPVPLVRYVISSKKKEYLFEQNIWSGDFDSFLEKHLKKTIVPIDNN